MILWRALTIIFGALPATWLGYFAVMGSISGMGLTFQGIFELDVETFATGFFLFGWSGFGLLGVCALWSLGLNLRKRWEPVGLAAGTIAIVPVVREYVADGPIDLWASFVFGPPVVVCAWLLLLLLRPINEDLNSSDRLTTGKGSAK